MPWKPCIDGRCSGVVRKHDREGRCEECGYAPPTAEPVRDTDTLDMFGAPAQAPAQPVKTSEDAAAKVSPKLSQRRRDLLLYIMENHPDGVTDNELLAELGPRDDWSVNGIRNRRIELYRSQLLEQDGERDGSMVWIPSEDAHRWYTAVRRGRAAA